MTDPSCPHCRSRQAHRVSRGGTTYVACGRCARTYASVRDEVHPAAARAPRPDDPRDADFERVKRRLEAFLRRLDEQDPCHALGVPPSATLEQVRARYHDLALRHHPDRGGDAATMARFTRAYDQLRERLARRG